MKVNYTITEELYAEVIEYQMRLHNSQRSQVLKYWLSNLIFCGAALYFLITRTDDSWAVRLAPVGMAVVLLVLSTYRRVNLPKRARSALKRYMRDGTLEEGFIGPHTLIVENGKVRRRAGKNWSTGSCTDYGGFLELEHSELLIIGGVIFDLIPKDVLNRDNNREALRAALGVKDPEADEKVKEERESLSEGADAEVQWKVDEGVYVRGMVDGHRLYYGTRKAWTGSQLIRLVIFGYGVVVLCLRMNLYLGIGFVLIGIMLNRQLLTTFSPLAYWVTGRQVASIKGNRADLGVESFYIKDRRLTLLCAGQKQSTKISDITVRKRNEAYAFAYTASGQMFVIPRVIFSDSSEEKAFLTRLGWKA